MALIRLLMLLFTLVPAGPSLQAGQQSPRVLVLGDSLGAGYGVEAGLGWVDLLAGQFCAEQARCSVQNASISGDTTGGGRQRLPGLLRRHQPDILIIELGGNDGLRGYPLNSIRDNLATLIEAAQAVQAQVLLIGMHIPPNYGRRYGEGFHSLYRELAQEYSTALVPFLLDGVATIPELMQADGIHPTAAAQQRILDNLLPHLLPLLELGQGS